MCSSVIVSTPPIVRRTIAENHSGASGAALPLPSPVSTFRLYPHDPPRLGRPTSRTQPRIPPANARNPPRNCGEQRHRKLFVRPPIVTPIWARSTGDIADGECARVEIDRQALGERVAHARAGDSQHHQTVGLRDHRREAVKRIHKTVREAGAVLRNREPAVRPDAEERNRAGGDMLVGSSAATTRNAPRRARSAQRRGHCASRPQQGRARRPRSQPPRAGVGLTGAIKPANALLGASVKRSAMQPLSLGSTNTGEHTSTSTSPLRTGS